MTTQSVDVEAGSWWPEVFSALAEAEDAVELFGRTCRFAECLGFRYCSFGMRVTLPEPTVAVFDSYPNGWMEHYRRCNYLLSDPTVELGANMREAIIWSDRVFSPNQQLWFDANQAGLRVGVAQSSWGSRGTFGLLSLARESEALTHAEIMHLQAQLRWLADNTHSRMQSLMEGGVTVPCKQKLSAREREVMTWTADGKTSWEISQILTISESTVNFHIKNVVAKLDARNKVQAAAKVAAMGGLLWGQESERWDGLSARKPA